MRNMPGKGRVVRALTVATVAALSAGLSIPDASAFTVGYKTLNASSRPGWFVTIGMPGGKGVCSGALTKLNRVVTAAHCVTDDQGHLLTGSFVVILGSDDNHPKKDYVYSSTKPRVLSPGSQKDVAILQLDKNVIGGAVLAVSKVALTANSKGALYGTGTTPKQKEPGNDINQLEVSVKAVGDRFATVTSADNKGRGCKGDSGGPLVVKKTLVAVMAQVSDDTETCPEKPPTGQYTAVGDVHAYYTDLTG